jgi:hypothetical protein
MKKEQGQEQEGKDGRKITIFGGGGSRCLLSLWRATRGSKLMRLELTHGLFIT